MSLKKALYATGVALTTGVVIGAIAVKAVKDKIDTEENRQKVKDTLDTYKKQAKKMKDIAECKGKQITKDALEKVIGCSQEMLDNLGDLEDCETPTFFEGECTCGENCNCEECNCEKACEEDPEKTVKETDTEVKETVTETKEDIVTDDKDTDVVIKETEDDKKDDSSDPEKE